MKGGAHFHKRGDVESLYDQELDLVLDQELRGTTAAI